MEYKKDNRFEQTRHPGGYHQTQAAQPKAEVFVDQKKEVPFQSFAYIMRKSEKLTTALYLVTDILSDKEPLKWKAREAGVEVLSDITIASSTSVSEKMSLLRMVIKKIEKVVAFLDVASSARMMSEMNATMLKKEYLALKESIEAEWNRTHERSKSILSPQFFDVKEDLVLGIEEEKQEKKKEATFVPSPSVKPATLPHTPHERKPALLERTISHPAPSMLSETTPLHARPEVSREDRRKIILALIRQKPSTTVSDISKSLTDISEKTIQRELLAMVEEHVLVKRGERRWSTYSLREA